VVATFPPTALQYFLPRQHLIDGTLLPKKFLLVFYVPSLHCF